MDGLKILRAHPKALNDPLLTEKDSLLCKLLCPQNNQHLKDKRHDLFIFIAWVLHHSNSQSVYMKRRKIRHFPCSLRMRMMSDLCNKYGQITASFILSVLDLTYLKLEQE